MKATPVRSGDCCEQDIALRKVRAEGRRGALTGCQRMRYRRAGGDGYVAAETR